MKKIILGILSLILLSSIAVGQTSQISSPVNGATSVDASQLIQISWSTVANTDEYVLWIGSTQETSDVYYSGALQGTSLTLSFLPNKTYYLTIWTKFGAQWYHSDSTFTTGSQDVSGGWSSIGSPSNGATNVDASGNIPVSWNATTGALSYNLSIGTAQGLTDVYVSGELTSTSASVFLQASKTYYLRLWTTTANGVRRFNDSTLTTGNVGPASLITYPGNGGNNIDASQLVTISWSQVRSPQAYFLYVGKTLGASDVYSSGETLDLSRTLSLDPSTTYYLRINTKLSDGVTWLYSDSSFTTGPQDVQGGWSSVTSPLNAAQGVDASGSIQINWTAIQGAQSYALDIGSNLGGTDVVHANEGPNTSAKLFLNANTTYFLRVWTTTASGVLRFSDSNFTTGTTGPASLITSPANGASTVPFGPEVPITWSAVRNPQAYFLYVGTTLGGMDVYGTGETPATSTSIALNPSTTYYLRIWTKRSDGIWVYTDSSFTTAAAGSLNGLSTIVNPSNGSVVDDRSAVQISWNSVPNAVAYDMVIGTSPGAADWDSSGTTSNTTWKEYFFPSSTYYVRIWTKFASGVWGYTDSSFTTASQGPTATISTPPNGATGIDGSAPLIISWNQIANVQGYELQLGTTPGGNDVYDSDEISGTSASVNTKLDPGKTYYLQLWTAFDDYWWLPSNSTFTTESNSGPSLALRTKSTPSNTIDLTNSEALDWTVWSPTGMIQKAGGNIIGSFQPVGDTEIQSGGSYISYTWSDGTPTSSGNTNGQTAGLYSAGDSIQLSIPSDTTPRTLKLYVSCYWLCAVSSNLSDGTTPSNWASPQWTTEVDEEILIDFRSASAGQTLTVTLTNVSNAGYLQLDAASLSLHDPEVAIVSPADGQSLTSSNAVQIQASATQMSGLISSASLFVDANDLFDLSSSPYSATWSNPTPGHHVISAQATDENGLSGTSDPIQVDVVGSGGELILSSTPTTGPIDLSAEGTADWRAWGWYNFLLSQNPQDIYNLPEFKVGVQSQISDVIPIGNQIARPRWGGLSVTFTDGTPMPDSSIICDPSAGCTSEAAIFGIGNGLQITVPADQTERTLTLYGGVEEAAATLTAYLSDGSAAPVKDATLSNENDADARAFRLVYRAASAGQTLTVKITSTQDFNWGDVFITAATLQGPSTTNASEAVTGAFAVSNSGGLQQAVPGDQIAIYGIGFGDIQGNGSVTIGNLPATVVSWSANKIVAQIPAAACDGAIILRLNDGNAFSTQIKLVFPSAKISLSPQTIVMGATVAASMSTSGCSNLQLAGSWSTLNGDGSQSQIASGSPASFSFDNPGWVTVAFSSADGVENDSTQFNVAVDQFTITPSSAGIVVGNNLPLAAIGNVGKAVVPGLQWQLLQGSAIASLSNTDPPTLTANSAGTVTVFASGYGYSSSATYSITSPTAGTPPSDSADFEDAEDSPVVLTDSFGNISTYSPAEAGGKRYVGGSTGSGCSSCTMRGSNAIGFDAYGNVTSSTDALGHVTRYAYDSDNNITTAAAQLDNGSYAVTTYTYNSFGEPLTVTDALGNTTSNGYDQAGNLTSITTPAPDGQTPGSTTQFRYDLQGQLTRIIDPLGHVTTVAYTPEGYIQSIGDAQGNTSRYEYDVRGNRIATTDAIGQRTSFAYDLGNRLVSITYPNQTSVLYGYDYRSRRASVTDQNGKVTTYTYDDTDHLLSVTDAASNTTSYSYDSEGNLLTITDALGRTTGFAYNAFGWVTQTLFPSNRVETYGYDAIGNLTSKTDRKGQTIVYLYDALNRLSHKVYPDSSSVEYVYDLVGKLEQLTDPTGSYGFSYDNMGRLTGTTTQYSFLTGQTFTEAYSYDAASNRKSFTSPDGSSNQYGYDSLNRLKDLTSSWAGRFGFSYDSLSRRTAMTRPNGIGTSYNYNAVSQLLSVLHGPTTGPIDGASYIYDNAGNRRSRWNARTGVADGYTFDEIYQLTRVVEGANTMEQYSYDQAGNRLSSLTTTGWNYNSSDQLETAPSASYSYDYNGNTISKVDASGTTGYVWDVENRLTQVALPGDGGVVSFKYDPAGRRIQKNAPSGVTNFLYDGADIVAEYSSSGVLTAKYTQGIGNDEPLAMNRQGTTVFYNSDGLGSVTSLTDVTGALTNSYTYDSFGIQTNTAGAFFNPFRYTGREWDSETGLYYYRARYYDPSRGRFLSEDPIGWGGGQNPYSYVGNRPMAFVDPEGLKARVTQSGDTISVEASITIYGPRANAALAAQWQQIINDEWNRGGNYFRHGRCRVVFNISVFADPAHNKAAQATPADNRVYVRPNGFRSWVAATPGASYGEWSADGTWDKAHEAGHMFHLPDDYHDSHVNGQTISIPNPGHTGHMMGDYGGSVNQHEIDDLLRNNSCGCR